MPSDGGETGLRGYGDLKDRTWVGRGEQVDKGKGDFARMATRKWIRGIVR